MKKLILTIPILLILSSQAYCALNIWTQANGVIYADIYSLAVDTTTSGRAYAGSGAMFYTTNGGVSWMTSRFDPYIEACGSIVIDPIFPNIVWAGVGDGPFRSIDYASTWQVVGTNLAGFGIAGITGLYINPQNRAKMYAGTINVPFFISNDTGMTWQQSFSGMSTSGGATDALVRHPQDYNTFYAGVDGQPAIYVSTDGCSTWHSQFTAFGLVESLAIDPIHPNILYTGTYGNHFQENGGYIWKTNDGATTWYPLISYPLVKPITNILVNPENTDIVYIATWGAGVWKTKNGGLTWSQMSVGLSQSHVWCLAYDSTIHQLYCGTGTNDVIADPIRGVWTYIDTDLTSYFPVSIEPKIWQLFN